MRRMVHYAPRLAGLALLACGGTGLGMAWSSLTGSAIVWQRPERFAELEPAAVAPVDHFAAGRSWAQAAYDGGLRRCPTMNADFIAGCEAEMKALAARPGFAPGSYGGPLLVTTYEPPVPQPALDDLPPPEIGDEAGEELATEAPVPEVVPAAFERTPDNYPAADPAPPQ